MEDYLAALVRTNSAIFEAARGRVDVSCAQALPKDLGDWRGTIEFFLGVRLRQGAGGNFGVDFARSAERDNDAFCRRVSGRWSASSQPELQSSGRRPSPRSSGAAVPASRSRPRRAASRPAPPS